MKIAVVSYNWENQAELAAITEPNKREYCARHGYDAHLGVGGPWKFDLIRRVIDGYDAVLWADCDALFMQQSFQVEALVDYHGAHENVITITRDSPLSLNAGVFLIERNQRGVELLDWLNSETIRGDGHGGDGCRDQMMLNLYARSNPWLCRILPQRLMNSYLRDEYDVPLYEWSQYQPGDWICHLAGIPLARRIELARRMLECP